MLVMLVFKFIYTFMDIYDSRFGFVHYVICRTGCTADQRHYGKVKHPSMADKKDDTPAASMLPVRPPP